MRPSMCCQGGLRSGASCLPLTTYHVVSVCDDARQRARMPRRTSPAIRKLRAGQEHVAVLADAAAALRRLREERGWTQEEAAERIDLAVRHLQRIEAGTVDLSFLTLHRFCLAYGTDLRALLRAL